MIHNATPPKVAPFRRSSPSVAVRPLLLALTAALAAALPLLLAAPSDARAQARASSPSPFADWTAVVIAGDWTATDGRPIQAFDNAIRDLSSGFAAAGFPRESMVVHTLRPDAASPLTPHAAVETISRAAARNTGGCLLYFTSHGSPQGIVFGPNTFLTPPVMANLVRSWCGERPTVVVVSACYSGVFVSALQAPNRIIMTAARRDRSSFGCGEGSTYPYFDGCVLEALPGAGDFLALASQTRACVDRRETEEGLRPASEPQLFVGAHMQILAPTLRFRREE